MACFSITILVLILTLYCNSLALLELGQTNFTRTLLQNVKLQWKITDNYCALKIVNLEHNLRFDWMQLNGFTEPFEYLTEIPKRLIKNESSAVIRQGLSVLTRSKNKNYCTTVAFSTAIINSKVLDQLKRVGRPAHDYYIFITPLGNWNSPFPKYVHLLINMVKFKYVLGYTKTRQIKYLMETSTFTGNFIKVHPSQLKKYGFHAKTWNNLNGRNLNYTFPIMPPYVVVVSKRTIGSRPHFAGSIFQFHLEVSKRTNFTQNINYIPNLATGNLLPNGTWTEGMGVVQQGHVDVLGIIGVSFSRFSLVDFGMETSREDMIFCLTEPETIIQWYSLFRPLAIGVWGYTLLVFWIVAMLMYVYEKKAHLIQVHDGRIHEWLENTFEVILVPLGMFLEQPFPVAVTKNLVVILWLFGCIIIGTSYKSNLVGFLTLPEKPSFPKSFKDLNEHKEFVVNVHSVGGLERELWDNPNTAVTKGISKRVRYVSSLEKCLKEATKAKGICVGYNNILKGGIYKFLVTKENPDPLYMSREPVTTARATFGTKKGSIFYEVLNRFVGYAAAGDLIRKWNHDNHESVRHRKFLETVKTNASSHTPHILHENLIDAQDENIVKPLAMEHVFAVFWVLLLGHAVAFISYLIELLLDYFNEKKLSATRRE